MRSITVVSIIAAAVAGIMASAFLLTPSTGYVGSFDWPPNQSGNDQPEPAGQANSSNTDSPSTNSSGFGYRQVNITINGVELLADIAETNDQRTKGLSVKDSLAEDEAMLFVFNSSRDHSFWMKGMKFPIDIIWINKDKEAVHVEHSLEPCIPDEFCKPYKPDKVALYVLETVSGFASKYNVTEKTPVQFVLD